MLGTPDPSDLAKVCGLKVLIADHTASNRGMLEAFVRKLGFESVCAGDGREAVDKFGSERPDLVLMDVMMPVMDGFEATRKIRRLQQGGWVPVVMLSALAGEDDIAAGLDAGADDYLVKPISFAVFSAKMRSVTRLLMAQRAVTESLEQLHAISEAVIDGIVTIDESGIVQSCNRAACATFGYAREAVVGRNVSLLMPAPYDAEHDAHIARYLAGGPARIVGTTRQVTGRRANGELFPLELGVTDIELPGRRLFVGVVRDVSERERVARERAETRARLDRLHAAQAGEHELARQVMARQVKSEWLADPRAQHAIRGAAAFCGDVVMLARSPLGNTYALLADAAGRGLAAAISVLPVVSRFYGEVARDAPLEELIGAINDQLLTSLPPGRFVGAAAICLCADASEAAIWVGGLPAALLLDADGTVARRIASRHVALGIVAGDADYVATERIAVTAAQQLMLYSDGLIEACAADGQAFGAARLEQALAACAPNARVAAVERALEAHLGGAQQHDDVSMLILSCEPHREAMIRAAQ